MIDSINHTSNRSTTRCCHPLPVHSKILPMHAPTPAPPCSPAACALPCSSPPCTSSPTRSSTLPPAALPAVLVRCRRHHARQQLVRCRVRRRVTEVCVTQCHPRWHIHLGAGMHKLTHALIHTATGCSTCCTCTLPPPPCSPAAAATTS